MIQLKVKSKEHLAKLKELESKLKQKKELKESEEVERSIGKVERTGTQVGTKEGKVERTKAQVKESSKLEKFYLSMQEK